MATKLSLRVKQILFPARKICVSQTTTRSFTGVYNASGAYNPRPLKERLGLSKVFAVVIPFLTFGAWLGQEGATFLEENDIFVPDDDDD